MKDYHFEFPATFYEERKRCDAMAIMVAGNFEFILTLISSSKACIDYY